MATLAFPDFSCSPKVSTILAAITIVRVFLLFMSMEMSSVHSFMTGFVLAQHYVCEIFFMWLTVDVVCAFSLLYSIHCISMTPFIYTFNLDRDLFCLGLLTIGFCDYSCLCLMVQLLDHVVLRRSSLLDAVNITIIAI